MASSSQVVEPLLQENPQRYVMFPIEDQEIFDMYKKQVDSFWRVEEVDLSKDLVSWDTLSKPEKHFISMILAFFAASDGIVLENIVGRFMTDVQLSEARAFYGFQIAMENIHSEMYSLLIEKYITDAQEKTKLFHALEEFPCIRKKADWAIKWITDKRSDFATRLVVGCLCRGYLFLGRLLQYLLAQEQGIDAWSNLFE